MNINKREVYFSKSFLYFDFLLCFLFDLIFLNLRNNI